MVFSKNIDNIGYGLIYWRFNNKYLQDTNNKNKVDFVELKVKNINDFKYYNKDYIRQKKNNLFEIIGNDKYSKLFIDIDRLHIKKQDLKQLLLELYDKIDTYFIDKLNKKLYYVYVKYSIDDTIINSIHIIHKSKISFDYGNLLLEKLKQSKLNVLTDNIDLNLYNKNRQFCMPYNSKPYSNKILDYGYNNPIQSNEIIFTDFNIRSDNYDDIQTKNILNYSISILTEDLTELKLKNISKKDKEIIEKNKNNFNNIDTDYNNRKYKLCINLNNKDIIIKKCIELLDKDFYKEKNKNSWKNLIYQFKKLKLSMTDIEEFLNISSYYGDLEKYNYDKNIEYFNNLKLDNNIKCDSYNIISKILNTFNKEYFIYTDYIKYNIDSIINYIHEKTNINKSIIKSSFNNIIYNEDTKEQTIKINKNTIFNITNGFLKYDNKIDNYYIELEHRENNKKNNKNNNDREIIEADLIDSEEVREEIYNFKMGFNKYLAVFSKWGTGKSYHIVKPIIKHFLRNNEDYFNNIDNVEHYEEEKELLESMNRIVMITPTNSLNKKECEELEDYENSNFTNHLELQKLKKEEDYKEYFNKSKYFSMITSLESLEKSVIIEDNYKNETNYYDIDLLILDEFESIFNHFESNTINQYNSKSNKIDTAYNTFNYFKKVIKKAKQIIILDADITEERIELLENIIEE